MKTFTVSATRTIFVYTEIEAKSIDDAYEQIDNADFEIDWRNGDTEDDIIVEDMKNGTL
jgi:hypothetical protein